ncbi:MAG: TIGR01458 family HAD-type hydrolase [Candidatus Zixiibacteriota bacterium]|nr:MAG: TIGR01458 family HAD-type hydrolase [candidate division Zixibacteria bacterium]
MDKLSALKALLIDLDGTVYIGDALLPGAAEAIAYLREKHLPFRFTTNTTTRSTASLYEKLRRLGLDVREGEIFGAIPAAVRYLRQFGRPKCFFLLTEDPLQDFAEFPHTESNPDFVVVGDIGKRWNYELTQKVFEMLMGGSKLLALHKGKYWQTEHGLQVDMGAFVAGLEYVTGRPATVVGKPAKEFFTLALSDLGVAPEEAAMIGDDIESDIGGAQAAGLRGILVKTGKYRDHLAAASAVTPDAVVDSIAALPEFLPE